MRRPLTVILLGACFVIAFAASAPADQKPLESRITSVGLFKNGLAVVERLVTIPEPGDYRIDDVPQPVHGTFWIKSEVKVSTRLTQRMVEVAADRSSGSDFQQELIGKEVTAYFGEGIPPVVGTVVDLEPPRGEAAWNRTYEQPRYYYYSSGGNQQPPRSRFLVLQTETGRCYLDFSKVAYLQARDVGDTVKRSLPVLILSVGPMAKKPATLSISYLTKGLAWAPSYLVDISNPKTLSIRQKAVVKNELADIANAEFELISGFPSIQCSNVTSPLSLSTTWASFFQQLNQPRGRGNAATSNYAFQSQMVFNARSPDQGIDLSAIPTGEGVDLHYQTIGKQTLAEGDSLAVEVASDKADYERIVEWIVPDTRKADGRYISENERNQDPDKYEDAAWDAVRFRNPFSFCMTTAPAMVVSEGRFNGQRMSYYVNPGEETTVHVTKALSVRTRSVEHEEEGEREIVYVGGDDFRRTTVTGRLWANNHRKEPIKLVIRRRFSGDLVEADQSPKCVLLEEGVYSVNKRNQLDWSLELDPGKEVELTYRYTVLVNR